nr:MFS transporter [Acidobacteriota bacterium]
MKSGGFLSLLRSNRNYRFAWIGQVVSEAGDNFNNIAVFSVALANTGSGLVVAAILLSRAISMLPAGPIAGVLLDRMDRRCIMILSDLVRAAVALAFIFAIPRGRTWLLYFLSGLLMFASPFFTSGRAAILPSIATRDELHTANALTQLTQWTALAIGSFLGGVAVIGGYHLAFAFNAFSFLFSAACIWQLRVAGGFRAAREAPTEDRIVRPWREYVEG